MPTETSMAPKEKGEDEDEDDNDDDDDGHGLLCIHRPQISTFPNFLIDAIDHWRGTKERRKRKPSRGPPSPPPLTLTFDKRVTHPPARPSSLATREAAARRIPIRPYVEPSDLRAERL
ncbi:hypothetical protein AXG93_3559s1150 [Marchantia polymorpha subsp. ruderalis]|uniref:Uncharacterized protein n=1 Tax=Marchantia polymorpha subsp. ruderalis TaxID=1480154 RepID=A0A176WKZ9_MARPO|nr:hypothetical protein AXG93_3559s1150 [Marchantia polymorpha subsp. ruderalis]